MSQPLARSLAQPLDQSLGQILGQILGQTPGELPNDPPTCLCLRFLDDVPLVLSMPLRSKQILTQLSTDSICLETGSEQFEVRVKNLSDRFATFALELSAPGAVRDASPDWYRLTPDISAKIPAGDQANFIVNLLALPPVPGGFPGKMNLNVNVACLELGEEDRQSLNLEVKGSGVIPPELSISTTKFQGIPGDLIEIPLSVENHNRNTANIQIEVKQLPESWLIEGCKRRLQLPPGGRSEVRFMCQPPSFGEAVSDVYSFEIEARQILTETVRQAATLEILPAGALSFTCVIADSTPNLSNPDDSQPAESRSDQDPSTEGDAETVIAGAANELASTYYTLTLDNASNVEQSVGMALNRIDAPWFERLWATVRRRSPEPALTTRHGLHLSPAQVDLKAEEAGQMTLAVWQNPPWFGWRRRQQFQLLPQLHQTDINPSEQRIELIAAPKIPFWLQCLVVGCLGLGLGLILNHIADHRGPVKSVQFDGQANRVISGADDQTIRRWQVVRGLRHIETLKKIDKAVRVVRYRPYNNDVLAAGLENSEILIWDFLSAQTPKRLIFETDDKSTDDRVFDLQFSHDSRSLFSAHGSGKVLRWDLQDLQDRNRLTQPAEQKDFDFAIEAIALIEAPNNGQNGGKDGAIPTALAIAGRYNRLELWNTETDQVQRIAYPPGNGNDYITSLDVADNNLARLVTADHQGRISLWDVSQCWSIRHNCLPTDQWSDGHQNQPINAVALTKDACYLVSGGADGRVMLWPLNSAGQVIKIESQQLAKFSKSINSVDIAQKENKLLVVSGSDTHQVKLRQVNAKNAACP